MKSIHVHNARTRLSALLGEIQRTGKGVVICRNGEPIADLVPDVSEVSMAADRRLGAIKIKYDPTEEADEAEWPAGGR